MAHLLAAALLLAAACGQAWAYTDPSECALRCSALQGGGRAGGARGL